MQMKCKLPEVDLRVDCGVHQSDTLDNFENYALKQELYIMSARF